MIEELTTYWLVELKGVMDRWVPVCGVYGIPFTYETYHLAEEDALILSVSEKVPARVVEVTRKVVFGATP